MRQAFLQGFRQRTVSIAVIEVVPDCADPKDNQFLALAAAADAELILASDIHLTTMHISSHSTIGQRSTHHRSMPTAAESG